MADPSRLRVLASLEVPEADRDADFERVARVAAGLFGARAALVNLVDLNRQRFPAAIGLDKRRLRPELAFGAHTLGEKAPLLVLDTAADGRFARNPLVTGPPCIRFYAGAPIVVRKQRIGTLAVVDFSPRPDVAPEKLDRLGDLAAVAASLFDLKDEARVRARTTAELVREEWRHALTLEAGKVGSWVWDLRTGEVVANDILKEMYGLVGQSSMRMEDVFAAIHPDDLKAVERAFSEAFEGGRDYICEFRIAHSGRWIMSRGRVYQRDASGNPLVIMGVNIDMTEERESAQRTRALLRELNHRVKNTLAMIQALARQTLKHSPDPQRFIDAFSGRLRTLSDAHVLLSDRDWRGIGLIELLHAEVSPYIIGAHDRLVLHGQDLQLPPDHALGLGLILNELGSNAALYGALSNEEGQISVSWTRRSVPGKGDEVQLIWKEQGGPPVAAARQGLGTRLIEHSLDKVLDSRVSISFPADGVEARITFALPEPG